jgi:hypothetical protein
MSLRLLVCQLINKKEDYSMSTTQKITVGLGIFYVLIGILGFIPGITVPSGEPGQGLLLGIFAVNTLHNITHLLVGVVLIGGGMSAANVRTVNKVMAVVFLILTIGSFVAPIVEQVALNPPDTILHLLSTLLTGYLGFLASRDVMPSVE